MNFAAEKTQKGTAEAKQRGRVGGGRCFVLTLHTKRSHVSALAGNLVAIAALPVMPQTPDRVAE